MQSILARLLLLMTVYGFAAEAQEASPEMTEEEVVAAEIEALEPRVTSGELAAEIDELEPGLSTEGPAAGSAASAEQSSTEDRTPGSEAVADEREALEPSVPSAVLAQDVRRRAAGNGVMDEIDLGRTEITGNQELPKVLYIVPWQKSDPGNLTGKPVNTLLDEVLAPIDRSEFIRQVDYYGDLYGEDEE